MQRLGEVTGEVDNELEGACACYVGAVADLALFGGRDAVAEDHALICNRRDDAAALGAVPVVIGVADGRWL